MDPTALRLFDRITVPLDGSEEAERALPVAAALAHRAGTTLTLLMVVSHQDHVPRAHALLDRAAARVGDPAVPRRVLVGLPAATRLVEAIDRDATVAVMATHARKALAEMVLGSVAEEVVRRARRPVILAGPNVAPSTPSGGYTDLVVCIDRDDVAERLAPVVTSAARERGLHPCLLQVMTAPRSGDAPEAGTSAHRAAAALAAAGVDVDVEVRHADDAVAGILEVIRSRSAPLVVVATHGRDPAASLRAGSVTVTLARRSEWPVLVLGPWFSPTAT